MRDSLNTGRRQEKGKKERKKERTGGLVSGRQTVGEGGDRKEETEGGTGAMLGEEGREK